MKNVKILAIDDNADNIVVLKALLHEAFPEAAYLSALSGKKGIEVCLSEMPDVILLDIVMPEMDGYEVCRNIKENDQTKTIPIIIITAARTDKESRIRALEMGADAFLTKPVDETELTAQIRAMLRIKESEDRKLDENERLKQMVAERTKELLNELKERRLVEEALRESESKYSILYKDSPDSYLIISDGVFVDCNKATEEMMRCDRTQILGKSPDEISPEFQPDGRKSSESAEEKIADAFLNGKNTFEWVHRRLDGSDIYVEVSLAPIMLKGKQNLFTTWRDITKRKLAEQKLMQNEEKYRMFIDLAADAFFQGDENGNFIEINNSAIEITGYSRSELLQMNMKELFSIKLNKSKPLRYDLLSQGKVIKSERELIRKDARTILVDMNSKMMPDGSYQSFIRDITERKLAEEVLKNTLSLTEATLESIHNGILVVDDKGSVVRTSSRFAEMWNISADILSSGDDNTIMNSILDKLTDPEEFVVKVQELYTKPEAESNDLIYFKDGRIFERVSKPMYLGGEPKARVWSFLDITDRKQAELALKESEDRYRSFISQVSEGVYRFESDQPMDITLPLEEQIDFIYDHFFVAECNEAILDIYKLSNENEMIGKRHLDFHGGRNNEINRELVRSFILNRYSVQNGITEEHDSNGKLLYLSNNSVGIIENNHLIRTWGTETDITEKIRSEQIQQVIFQISNATISSSDLSELLEIISKLLATLLDFSNFYIASYDESNGMLTTLYEKGDIDKINIWPAEKSLTGLVINKRKSLLLNEADTKNLRDSGEVKMVGVPSKIWMGVPLIENKKIFGAIVVQSYENPNAFNENDLMMLEFVSHQISISIERKKAEQELKEALVKAQESDRLKSAFLANMSHEIRTPLNSIIGFSDLLLDSDFGLDQQQEFAQMISASGNGLLQIINDIMDLSKIESGETRVIRNVFSIQQLLREIRKEYSFKAIGKGNKLRMDPANPEEEIYIESDEQKLKQIMINFVSNAIKFTEKGSIDLSVRLENNLLKIIVKDNGIGIPEEFHKKIFERFRQVESAETRKYGGNGLGLAISKSLAELIGGVIGMKSVKDEGSTFFITIPYTKLEKPLDLINKKNPQHIV